MSVSSLPQLETVYQLDNWRVLTPIQSARETIKANPHITPAQAIVRSWQQSASGWTMRHATMIAANGVVNLHHAKRYSTAINHNGFCERCGEIFPDYVLKWGSAPDGWLLACPSCVASNHLHTSDLVSPFLTAGAHASRLARRPDYINRIFIDLTNGGEIELSVWSDYQDARAEIAGAVDVLRGYVREQSRNQSLAIFDELSLMRLIKSGDHNAYSTLRGELRRVEKLIDAASAGVSVAELLRMAAAQ